MRKIPGFTLSIAMGALAFQTGCVASVEEQEDFSAFEDVGEEEVVGEAEQEVVVVNALTSNALTSNALTSNALTSNALTSNALTSNALTSNSLTKAALKDAKARLLLQYITSCALEKGKHFDVKVDGQTYGFDGELGLAPKWGKANGKCDGECRSWVSGCVISRVDYLGQPLQISIRGKHPALSTSLFEWLTYRDREATYYGDIFAKPQQLFACLSPGKTQIPRVCGPSVNNCFLNVVGNCNQACNWLNPDGSYSKCEDNTGYCGGNRYEGSVTVFRE
ncbi:hypothetical protein [Chondromyces crocatus]|uniref:Membrane protein n=1 Tax=Chondromyces crocatus TaxID=52 RepID=A0A0K1EGQ8_CHOCO|nr:hypothetical protein [Chondromyces crocatus]AKT40050.1 membrane protein [Chondromyces crocatus]